MIRIGLIGYGKAGSAVAQVLREDPRFDLSWVARRTACVAGQTLGASGIPLVGLEGINFSDWLDTHPVDALVDFSVPQSLLEYGEELKRRELMLVSAISAYSEAQLDYARSLGEYTRILCSPNITLGINFLIMAAKLLRNIAPFADVEILSNTSRKNRRFQARQRRLPKAWSWDRKKSLPCDLAELLGTTK